MKPDQIKKMQAARKGKTAAVAHLKANAGDSKGAIAAAVKAGMADDDAKTMVEGLGTAPTAKGAILTAKVAQVEVAKIRIKKGTPWTAVQAVINQIVTENKLAVSTASGILKLY